MAKVLNDLLLQELKCIVTEANKIVHKTTSVILITALKKLK